MWKVFKLSQYLGEQHFSFIIGYLFTLAIILLTLGCCISRAQLTAFNLRANFSNCICLPYSVHPYIFFNRDWNCEEEVHYDSMTFVGFNLQQIEKTVHLFDLSHKLIIHNIMSDGLYRWLKLSGVETRQDPDNWTKWVFCILLYFSKWMVQQSWQLVQPLLMTLTNVILLARN